MKNIFNFFQKKDKCAKNHKFSKPNDAGVKRQQFNKIALTPFTELANEEIEPFGDRTSLAEFQKVQAMGYLRVYTESIKIMGETTSPTTFFKRYETAVANVTRAIAILQQFGAADDLKESLVELIEEKEEWVEFFIDRCYRKGILDKVKDTILNYSVHLSEDNIEYMQELLEEDDDDDCDYEDDDDEDDIEDDDDDDGF